MHYIVSDYCATGEGRTISFLISYAYPRAEDYASESGFDETGKWQPGILKDNIPERLKREFTEKFGDYLAIGANVVSRQEFMQSYGDFIPMYVSKIIDDEEGGPWNFKYSAQLHFNYC